MAAEGVEGIPVPAVNPVPEADLEWDLLRERDQLRDWESRPPPPPPLKSSLTRTYDVSP